MSARRQRRTANRPDPATEAFEAGAARIKAHPALGSLGLSVCRVRCDHVGPDGWAVVDSAGYVHIHPKRRAEPDEWAWVLAHCLLHRGFGHVPQAVGERIQPDECERAARCAVVNRFLADFSVGSPPMVLPAVHPGGDETELTARWRRDGIPAQYRGCGAGGSGSDLLLLPAPTYRAPFDWQDAFARALTRAMSDSMDRAGTVRDPSGGRQGRRPWDRALSWFVSSYPLLGGVAAGMTLVADTHLARDNDIAVAAVDARLGEIYLNPAAGHTEEEWRFILGHELLHAALRHRERCGPRDPYLFNVACDYVVNGWLLRMRVGDMPHGLLYDPELTGLSAEEVYDRIATDLRRARRLRTLRGRGVGDVLGEPLGDTPREYTDLDAFYRRGLVHGLDLHRRQGRGLLPAGLVEEIRALSHPPVPWDVRLARWFDEYVPRPESVRSYTRPSRRQASTPDIPRAGRHRPPEEEARCTFGVVLDTSGSMDGRILGRALGAIASYAVARDVPAARVVFCDAAPHDAGYLPVTEIAGRVEVRGRGGTVLQPAVDLLGRVDDFPDTAPILVITDGRCDRLRIRREHAFLIPDGARLPFPPVGPVFRVDR